MNESASEPVDVGRWLTIAVGFVIGLLFCSAGVSEYFEEDASDRLLIILRGVIWGATLAWFTANAVRVADTLRPTLWRIALLVALGIAMVWIGSYVFVSLLDNEIVTLSDTLWMTTGVSVAMLGIIAFLSVFRHGLLNGNALTEVDEASATARFADFADPIYVLGRTVIRSVGEIRRDPIRWCAIAGGVWWPIGLLVVVHAVIPQAIAITCAIRYADTFGGSQRVRLALLISSAIFAWFNAAVIYTFDVLSMGMVAPSLLLWTASVALAMFKPWRNANDQMEMAYHH